MAQDAGTTSVFTDDSGTRTRLVSWTVRGGISVIVLAVLAITVSLITGVPLPTPVGPLNLPGSSAEHAPTGSGDEASQQLPEAPPARIGPSASSAPTPAAVPASTRSTKGSSSTQHAKSAPQPTSTPAVPVPTPTRSPGSKANHGVASTKSPRATPTHKPGGPAPTPPGHTK